MLRIAVAAYLMVVTAAGPWACCCTAGRLTARFGDRQGRPTEPLSFGCCPHHRPPEAPDGRPERSDCPCRQGHSGDEVIVTEIEAAKHGKVQRPASSSFDLVTADPGTHALPRARGGSPADRPPRPAYPTAQDLIRRFHLLRC